MSLRAGDWVEGSQQGGSSPLARSRTGGSMACLSCRRCSNPAAAGFVCTRAPTRLCDTVNGTGGVQDSPRVHLEGVRCDGKAYGGCQAACLIFWKAAWLKPVSGDFRSSEGIEATRSPARPTRPETGCSEKAVLAGTFAKDQPATGGPKYGCQATDLPDFTTYLPWWDARQYVKDYTSGNASLGQLVAGASMAPTILCSTWARQVRTPFRWLYDRVVSLWGGLPFPRRRGVVPIGHLTPNVTLDLQPGELVRVKSYEAILATIDDSNKNRGLFFDAEMVPYCGKTFRVRRGYRSSSARTPG